MKLVANLKNYLLKQLLEKIASNQLTASEIQDLEAYGIDEHARHFIVLTNGDVNKFLEVYGTIKSPMEMVEELTHSFD